MTDTNIILTLNEAEAGALAQFVKRCYFSDYLEKATSEAQANNISSALYQLQKALAEQSFDPR